MLVEPVNYTHIREAKTAQETWKCLEKAFEDTGFARQVSLLRELVNTKLETCKSMNEYLNKIVSCVLKLKGAGSTISDELVAAFMLAGLTEEYRPIIMGIEGTNVKVTSEDIKTKLLHEELVSGKDTGETAMTARSYRKITKIKCFECGKEGHIARNCRKRSAGNEDKKDQPEDNVNLICLSAIHSSEKDEWIIDSGASRPMTNQKNWMINEKPTNESVTIANDTKINVTQVGDVKLKIKVGNSPVNATIDDVLYVPDLFTNLLSVSRLVKKGLTVAFDQSGCRITDKQSKVIATGSLVGDIFKLDQWTTVASPAVSSSDKKELWHRRFGHLGHDNLCKLNNKFVDGMNFITEPKKLCEICIKGKHSRLT